MEYKGRDKSQWLAMMRNEYRQWEALIGSLSANQITHVPPGDYSLNEAIGHLWAWEQLTLARLEAGLEDRELRFSLWPEPFDADTDEGTDAINANIQVLTRDIPWDRIYADWQTTFQRLIEVTEQIPEEHLMAEGRYKWLGGVPLAAAVEGAIGHHMEHLEALQAHFGLSSEGK
jgi:hypothetical protein